MKNYIVDILTPDKVVAKGLVAKSIKVDTVRGEVNILPEHTHLITSLFTGLLTVNLENGSNSRFTVSKGICKVLGNNITILSSESLKPNEVNKEFFINENQEITKKLQKTDLMADSQIESLYEKLDYNNAALKLLGLN